MPHHHCNFDNGPDFNKCDLSGILSMLGVAAAYYTIHNRLTTAIIRSSVQLRIRSPNIIYGNCPWEEHVHIPSFILFGKLIWIISVVNAVCGEGSSLLTNVIGPAVGDTMSGATLEKGCLDAATVIMNMYAQNGEAALAAVSFCKGAYSILTLVAHIYE